MCIGLRELRRDLLGVGDSLYMLGYKYMKINMQNHMYLIRKL